MLDSKRIRVETDRVRWAIQMKRTSADLDGWIASDERRRELLVRVETLKHLRNEASEEIGRRKKKGEDASAAIAEMKRVGDEIKGLDAEIAARESEMEAIQRWIPNIPHESAPKADDAAGNVVVRTVGTIRTLDFKPKSHWELAESLG